MSTDFRTPLSEDTFRAMCKSIMPTMIIKRIKGYRDDTLFMALAHDVRPTFSIVLDKAVDIVRYDFTIDEIKELIVRYNFIPSDVTIFDRAPDQRCPEYDVATRLADSYKDYVLTHPDSSAEITEALIRRYSG